MPTEVLHIADASVMTLREAATAFLRARTGREPHILPVPSATLMAIARGVTRAAGIVGASTPLSPSGVLMLSLDTVLNTELAQETLDWRPRRTLFADAANW